MDPTEKVTPREGTVVPYEGMAPTRTLTEIESRLQGIAGKISAGQPLEKEDREYLKNLSSQKLSSEDKLIGKFNNTGKINKITKNILDPNKNFEKVEKKALKISQENFTHIAEQRALAKLIIVYDQALNGSPFFGSVFKMIDSGQIPTQKDILKLLEKNNDVSPRFPKMAGSLALEIGTHKIYYDHEGKLFLSPPAKNVITQIQLTKANKGLSEKKKDEVIRIYDNLCVQPYNNMAPMLEFMKFFKEAKKNNPELTLKEAFESFDLNAVNTFDKYQSGNCGIIAAKLQSEIRNLDMDSAVIGHVVCNDWTNPPLPSYSQFSPQLGPWKNAYEVVGNATHLSVVFRFSNKQGEDRALSLHPGMGFVVREENDWSSIKDEEQDNVNKRAAGVAEIKDTLEFGNIENAGSTIKGDTKSKYKMVIGGKKSGELFGIDFIRGNLYLNGDGSKGLEGLPLKRLGDKMFFSIDLKDLQNLDSMGTYYIDGKEVQMKHLDVINKFYEVGQKRFSLPDDFVDNMLFLAENLEDVFDHVLLPPCKTARDTISEAGSAKKMWDECNNRASAYEFEGKYASVEKNKELIARHKEKFEGLSKLFTDLQKAIMDDKPDVVRQKFNEMKEFYKGLIEIQNAIENGNNQ